MSVGGARWRRHWRVTIGNGCGVSTTSVFGSGSGKRAVRLVVAVPGGDVWADTLLGPEGTSPPAVPVFLFWMVICALIAKLSGPGWGWACCGGVGVGGCLLRIAQWMRASLWSSC